MRQDTNNINEEDEEDEIDRPESEDKQKQGAKKVRTEMKND